MAEYIKREDALNAIRTRHLNHCNVGGLSYGCYRRAMTDIQSVPAAYSVNREVGTWIVNYETFNDDVELGKVECGYVCSRCRRWELMKEPFCDCGAEMVEDANG